MLRYAIGVLAVFTICVAIKLVHKYAVERLYKNSQRLIKLGDKLDCLYGKAVWSSPSKEKLND